MLTGHIVDHVYENAKRLFNSDLVFKDFEDRYKDQISFEKYLPNFSDKEDGLYIVTMPQPIDFETDENNNLYSLTENIVFSIVALKGFLEGGKFADTSKLSLFFIDEFDKIYNTQGGDPLDLPDWAKDRNISFQSYSVSSSQVDLKDANKDYLLLSFNLEFKFRYIRKVA